MTEELKSMVGDGKTVLGLLILLMGVGVSMLGYPAESEKLISIGEMLAGIGVVHKLVKAR